MSCSAKLKEQGLKLTPQRRLIIDIIHNTGAHLTAEEIIGHGQSKMPGVNKTTIYRTLELLEETGCILRSLFSREIRLYNQFQAYRDSRPLRSL